MCETSLQNRDGQLKDAIAKEYKWGSGSFIGTRDCSPFLYFQYIFITFF